MKFVILFILLEFTQLAVCKGPGTIFVKLILYQNPSGKTDAGKDCDSWFHQFVNDRCDLIFNICVKDADIKNQNAMCDVGFLSTLGHVFVDTQRVLFGNMIGFIPNPFNFTLSSMPENVRIGINVTDDDADGQELITRLDHTIQLPLVIDGDQSMVHKIVLSSKFSEISFMVYGQCAENYYGPGCATFCKPSFSRDQGHYACDKVTGQKYCLIGWTGDGCRQQDVCLVSNPCYGSSQCLMNGSLVTCECPLSLTGRYCDVSKRPCDLNPCMNRGRCIRPNDTQEAKTPPYICNCPHNFTGVLCELDVNECDSMPRLCDNGADCVNTFGSYYCVCQNNYWGIRCDKPPVYSVLGLDGSFLYKSHQTTINHNVIIILLALVVCLLLIIAALTVLYVKKHRSSLLTKNNHSGSETSVYSHCHYEDIDGKLKINDDKDALEEGEDGESYSNIYEQQLSDTNRIGEVMMAMNTCEVNPKRADSAVVKCLI